MRQKIVAGNWKMNKTRQEGLQLASEIDKMVAGLNNDVKVILAPPFIHLSELHITTRPSIGISAQNCASEASGAYTGEVSAAMIKSTGAEYVIIGHSERRMYYNENNQVLFKKVQLALANGLIPIFCIGELLAEREANKHFDVVKSQLVEGLFNLPVDDFKKIIVAYEPVWAIGTGKTATSAQAQEMHKYIRETIAAKFGKAVADIIPILYGGSCKPSNAKELFENPDVDGGLIGGASLVASDFIGIVTAF
jgi:triosephosphate isomerase (TIM)